MSNEFHFVKIDPSGLVRLSQLAHRIWPITFSEILTTQQIKYMLEWMYNPEQLKRQLSEGHDFYFLMKDKEEIGFVGLEAGHPDFFSLRIHKLYLLPEHHGKGFGKIMLQEIEKIASEGHFHQLHLNVNRFNKAVDFYKHVGFIILDEEDIPIGNNFLMEDYVMVKKIVS